MAHIYLAAPWKCKAQVRNFAAKLERAGHDITERWWEHREVAAYPNIADCRGFLLELQGQAHRDLAGIDDADAMVVLQLDKSEGKAFETGYAYNSEKPICVLVQENYGNLFQVMDEITMVRTEKEVLEWLQKL